MNTDSVIGADLSQEDALERIGAAQLLDLLVAYYSHQRFTVQRVGDQSPQLFSPRARGLKLWRNDCILVLECRRSSAHPVGPRDIERLCSSARAQQATGAIFVTAGQFSPRARLLGEQHPDLQLIDNQLLRQMLGAEVIARLAQEHPVLPAGPRHEPSFVPQEVTPQRSPQRVPTLLPLMVFVALLLSLILLTSR